MIRATSEDRDGSGGEGEADADEDFFGDDGIFGMDSATLAAAFAAPTVGQPLNTNTGARGVARVWLEETSMRAFVTNYVEARKPCVLACRKAGTYATMAEARRVLAVAALADIHDGMEVPLDAGSPEERRCSLGRFLRAIAGESEAHPSAGDLGRRYLRNLHLAEWFPDLAGRLRLPTVLGPNFLRNEAKTPGVPDAWRNWYELFISGEASAGFPFFHQDTCGVHALSMQLEGRKRFILAPPDARPCLDCGNLGRSTRSRVPLDSLIRQVVQQEQGGEDLEEVDGAFPRLAEAGLLSVELQPNEMLFIPSNWWHTACHGARFDRVAANIGAAVEEAHAAPVQPVSPRSESPSVTIQASFVDASLLDSFNGAWADHCNIKSLQAVGAGSIVS